MLLAGQLAGMLVSLTNTRVLPNVGAMVIEIMLSICVCVGENASYILNHLILLQNFQKQIFLPSKPAAGLHGV